MSVFSSRSVSASWVRNIGTPFSSSSLDAGGHGRVLTLTLVFAMIASRYVVTNSYSIGFPLRTIITLAGAVAPAAAVHSSDVGPMLVECAERGSIDGNRALLESRYRRIRELSGGALAKTTAGLLWTPVDPLI